MALFKTLIIRRIQPFRISAPSFNSLPKRCVSSVTQSNIDDDADKEKIRKEKKPLHVMFGEAVGVIDVREVSESESEDERRMIRHLKKLEKEISRLKKVKAEDQTIDLHLTSDEKIKKTESLSGLFGGKNVKRDRKEDSVRVFKHVEKAEKSGRLSGMFSYENVRRERRIKDDVGIDVAGPVVLKKLSTEMLMFIEKLYKGGYFYDANFLPGNTFDASYFEDYYSREYVKFAADRFAKDHQDIAKWLSGSQVKTVALYGCPNNTKKAVFPAKRLRAFFKVEEDTVCSKCVLRESCKFVNQNVWNGDTRNLNLEDTMKVIILYGLETVHPELPLPDSFKTTVNLLLKDIINLTKSTS